MTYQKIGGLLGNIREGIDIPENYTVCPFKSCGCGADVILSKAKTVEHMKLLDVTHNQYDGTKRGGKNYITDNIDESVGVEMNFPYSISNLVGHWKTV